MQCHRLLLTVDVKIHCFFSLIQIGAIVRTINFLNQKWNRTIFWFHDFSVKLNIRWMVLLSLWALKHLNWTLSEDWQLINNVSLREYKLQRELEIAQHQIQYYANYAHELQWQLLEWQSEQKQQAKTKKTSLQIG
jgi:hypothetical protein